MKNNILRTEQAFDNLAAEYDNDFTNTEIGRLLRSRTHEKLINIFDKGNDLLEINCGTGEDAVFLAQNGMQVTATDASVEMIKLAKEKVSLCGLEHKVFVQHCSFEALDSILEPGRKFDGVISNFGGINCAEDQESLAKLLTKRVKSGGYIYLCVMGRRAPWEWLLLGFKGEFSRIWKRSKGNIMWRGQKIRYFTPGEIKRYFISCCDFSNLSGLGFLLPPTYAGSIVSMFPLFFRTLNTIEKLIESVPGVAQLSDHFIIIFKKK